ncbi:hypothetical protein NY08_4488 [Rhodococcus sp. B7740]|nr:hypothetical protein NY08_4488 [Rhodococcus sp. B7740]
MVVTGAGVVVVCVVVGTGVVVDAGGGGWAADSLLQPARTSAVQAPIPTNQARAQPICRALLDRCPLAPHVIGMKKPRPTFRHRLLERPTIPAQCRHRPARSSRCGSDAG